MLSVSVKVLDTASNLTLGKFMAMGVSELLAIVATTKMGHRFTKYNCCLQYTINM